MTQVNLLFIQKKKTERRRRKKTLIRVSPTNGLEAVGIDFVNNIQKKERERRH